MWLRCLVAVLLVFWVQGAFAARVALVIGNAAYKEGSLQNPVNDARDMSAKLKELGFNVIARENLKRKEIPATLKAFRSQIKPGDDVLFFYAGHGVQVKGVNYLPAVDAEIGSEDEVDMESLSLNKLLELLDESQAAVKLVFLDACRNNPYARSFRSTDRGLSRVGVVAPSGTLISFATRPGSVAADGNDKNGLYTERLLKYLDTANTPVEMMLKSVVREVKLASSGQQEPWSEGNLDGDFYFRQTAALGASIQGMNSVQQGDSDIVDNPSIDGRYLPLNGGVDIKDRKTGLIWRRCVEGMTWAGGTCTGKHIKLSFNDAQIHARNIAVATGRAWRVPTKDELISLFDYAQVDIATSSRAFPATPNGWLDLFWTSSIENDSGNAWYVDFGLRRPNDTSFLGINAAIRLVRSSL